MSQNWIKQQSLKKIPKSITITPLKNLPLNMVAWARVKRCVNNFKTLCPASPVGMHIWFKNKSLSKSFQGYVCGSGWRVLNGVYYKGFSRKMSYLLQSLTEKIVKMSSFREIGFENPAVVLPNTEMPCTFECIIFYLNICHT